MNFVWLPRRGDSLQRVTSSLQVACLAGIVALTGVTSPAMAQSEVKSAVDGAGTAINNQLGDWLGVKKPPPPKRRTKPKPAAAKPAAVKPAEAKPAPAKPAVTTTAPVEQPKAQISPAPSAAPETIAAPKPAAAPKTTAAVPVPKPRPFDGTPKAAAITSEPITPLAVTPIPVTPPAMAKPAPIAAPMPLTAPRTAAANVPLPPRPPIARPSAPRLAALPSVEASPAMAEPVIPMPPARAPATAKTAALPPVEEAEPEEPAKRAAPSTPAVATICPELSNENLAVFTTVEVTATQSACTVDRGVSMSAVKMRDGRMVKLEPPAVLRCEMAASVANWLRDKVDPAVATLGSPLDVVMVAASQQCRPRNRVKGAKISEHGRGNALDTRGYVLENGAKYVIGRESKDAKAMPQAFQETLKASACADFTTILGPGSDGYHEEHLHVDRAVRRTTVSLCRWIIGRGGGN